MPVAGLIAFGVAVGLLSGTLGIGGGIALVPGLILLFGFSQLEAQGTSLAVLTVPVLIFAALVYHRAGLVRYPVVACIATGFVLGASSGAWLAPHLPHHVLRPIFGALLLYVGLLFLLDIRSATSAAMLPVAVATATLAIFARIFRRRLRPRAPTVGHWEYHI
jgi:hypothetical protein